MTETIPESARRRVGDIMATEVVTVSPDTTVNRVARLMSEHHISGLPVVDEKGQVVGVITELDMIVRNSHFKMPNYIMILDMIIYLEMPGHFEKRLEHVLGTTAEEIMSHPAVTIAPTASIADLADLMVEARKNPIPVVESGQLVGIVSRSDIVRLMVKK